MSRTRLAAYIALAVGTATGSLLGLAALNGGGEVMIGPIPLLRIGAGYDRRAQALTAPGLTPSATHRAEALRLSHEALRQAPYDSAARLRIAYLDALSDNRLSSEGLEALRRSYDLTPIDAENGVWRVQFCLTYASQIPPDLQAQVRNEVGVLMKNPARRKALVELSHNLPNLMGRFWLALWLRQLDRPVPK